MKNCGVYFPESDALVTAAVSAGFCARAHVAMLAVVMVHRCSTWVALFNCFPPLVACGIFWNRQS